MEVIGLTWFRHRRTTELCAGLQLPLVEFVTERRGLWRYLTLIVRTVAELWRLRPRVVLVQNPSLALAVLALTLRSLFAYRLVVDAHNEAIEPYIHRSRWIRAVTHWVLRRADLVIVSNRPLARVVARIGGSAFVLPDRIPEPPNGLPESTSKHFELALIATFAPDEPVEQVFEALRDCEAQLYVTGNQTKLAAAIRRAAPPNVTFAGFLSEWDYWSLLKRVNAVVDLTTMDNCLVCGAYEAVAAGKPLLLTRNEASTSLFGQCALFTDNSSADIRRCIEQLKAGEQEFRRKVVNARADLKAQWEDDAVRLRAALNRFATDGLGAEITE